MRRTGERIATAAWLVLTTFLASVAAQTPEPHGTGSVTGRLTLDGRPFLNAQVLLATAAKNSDPTEALQNLMEAPAKRRKATTDSEGRYRFSDLAAGSYRV